MRYLTLSGAEGAWARRGFLAAVFVAAASPAAFAQTPVMLEQALAEAAARNARLPFSAMDVAAAEQQARAARGGLLPRLSVEGAFQVAPPSFGYGTGGSSSTAGQEKLQLVGRQMLYDGGALRSQVSAADAQLRSSRAGFRVAQKDLDLEVRTRFSELIKAQEDVASRDQGLERLRSYLETVRLRKASGEGLQSDLLKTEVRLASLEADVEDGRRRVRAAQLALNDLLGRALDSPLVAAPLPPPQVPAQPLEPAWQEAPDLAMAQADQAAAEANVIVARATRRPHFDVLADAGLLGGGLASDVPSAPFATRLRNDLGASLTLSLSWSFLDFGIYAGQLGQAEARAEQARRRVVVQGREARLRWQSALADAAGWYRQVQIRERALPLARDAWLVAESLYRGGTGTALDVLDAFTNLLAASQSYTDAVLAFRVAEGTALRWGTP
ncbi:MAG TPA: TolC family protein [Myxococcales bacterium]